MSVLIPLEETNPQFLISPSTENIRCADFLNIRALRGRRLPNIAVFLSSYPSATWSKEYFRMLVLEKYHLMKRFGSMKNCFLPKPLQVCGIIRKFVRRCKFGLPTKKLSTKTTIEWKRKSSWLRAPQAASVQLVRVSLPPAATGSSSQGATRTNWML